MNGTVHPLTMTDDLLKQVKVNGAIPAHIAIIMDGNGRWAQTRSLPRPLGHQEGMKSVREVVEGILQARGEWDQAVRSYLAERGETMPWPPTG